MQRLTLNKPDLKNMRNTRLKEEERQPLETFSVQTIAGKVEKVPVTGWKDLVPYWESICRAIFEVLIQNDFKPYTATLKRPKGFVASNSYWKSVV